MVIKEGENLIEKYGQNVSDVKVFIDEMQWKLKCCGFNNASDWNQWKVDHGQQYPSSCCEQSDKNKSCLSPFRQGCAKPVEEGINANSGILIGVVVAYVAIQFVSMVLSCFLVSSIRKDYFQFV